MKSMFILLLLLGGFVALSTMGANAAVVCAAGVYRAGCVAAAPRAAVVVRRPVVVAPRAAVVRRRVY
jgi:dipeptide/tripeptide permease